MAEKMTEKQPNMLGRPKTKEKKCVKLTLNRRKRFALIRKNHYICDDY